MSDHRDWFRYVLEILRFIVFSGFAVLSIRVIFITLTHCTLPAFIGVTGYLVLWTGLMLWRKEWALYGFAAAIPVISGLQLLGLLSWVSLLSLGFSAMFLVWFGWEVLGQGKRLSSGSLIGNLVDLLAGLVLLSLVMLLVSGQYPLDFIMDRLLADRFSGQAQPLYGVDGTYILLQGMFFFRILTHGGAGERILDRIWQVMLFQAAAIICFSLVQTVFHIPMTNKRSVLVHAPFEDVHSYGSYLVLLFFALLGMCLSRGKRRIAAIVLSLCLLGFVFLSASFAAMGAVFIVGCVYMATQWRHGRTAVAVFAGLAALVLVWNHMYPTWVNSLEGKLAARYARGATIEKMIDKLGGRFMSADQALGIIQTFPITGSGVGTFYRISRYYHFSDTPHPHRIENAHNYYLQFCADLGIPAFLIFLAIIILAFKHGIARLRRAGAADAALMKGVLFGLAAYLITMVTGHPLLLSNQQFLFWFVLAVVALPGIRKSVHA